MAPASDRNQRSLESGLPDSPLVLLLVGTSRVYLEHLSASGFRLYTAASAFEAVNKSTVLQPDVVVMDLDLPGVDAHAALQEFRKRRTTRRIPVIAVSSGAAEAEGFDASCAGEPGQLLRAIRHVLGL